MFPERESKSVIISLPLNIIAFAFLNSGRLTSMSFKQLNLLYQFSKLGKGVNVWKLFRRKLLFQLCKNVQEQRSILHESHK